MKVEFFDIVYDKNDMQPWQLTVYYKLGQYTYYAYYAQRIRDLLDMICKLDNPQ
jgi:hypothetical protein